MLRRNSESVLNHNIHPLVKQLRTLANWHQIRINALAQKAGYERSTLRKWFEKGYRPNLDTFVDVAQALGYDVVLVKRVDADGQA